MIMFGKKYLRDSLILKIAYFVINILYFLFYSQILVFCLCPTEGFYIPCLFQDVLLSHDTKSCSMNPIAFFISFTLIDGNLFRLGSN